MAGTVLLLGTFDTKGHEYAFVRDRLRERNVAVLLVDTGINDPVGVEPDVARDAVAEAGGARIAELAAAGDRGAAVEAMARGAPVLLRRLFDEGRFEGILALGGSGGSSIATAAMRALPVGVPKLMVSTMAAGDTRPYVGATDVTMMPSVVDVAGVNSISARIMTNAAGAIAGMVGAQAPELARRKVIAATMFGVTTPCVTRARELLDELGYEVLVFHATGTGGQSMEVLVGRRLPRRRARHHHDRARRRSGGRRALGGTGPAGGGRAAGHSPGRLARRARHGQLRPAGHRPGAVRAAPALRAQPDGHADAHDAGGMRRAGTENRRASSRARAARRSCSCPSAECRRSTSRASRSTTRKLTGR